MHAVVTQQANDVPWTSPEDSLKVLTSGTLMGNSEDSQGTNTEIYDLMIKLYSRTIVLVLHTYPCSLLEKQIFKCSKWDVRETSTGPSCGTSRGPNDRTFYRCPWDVVQTCFSSLNSTHKHINGTLSGYSKLMVNCTRKKFSFCLKNNLNRNKT